MTDSTTMVSVRVPTASLERLDRHIAECKTFTTRSGWLVRMVDHYCDLREKRYRDMGRPEWAAELRGDFDDAEDVGD